MDKCLETHNLPKLNQEEVESMKRLTTASEIEAVIKKFPVHKSTVPDGFTGEFYQTFQEELTPILLKQLQKFQEEGRFTNLFYQASIILILKQVKTQENHRPKYLVNIDGKSST